MPDKTRIAVIGLGYVGLPLAVALARHWPVVGFDVDGARVAELNDHHDRTGEVAAEALAATSGSFTTQAAEIVAHDIYIVTVPTPVDADNRPDLTAIKAAAAAVGRVLAQGGTKGAIVVFESTVYPGVTEDICGPALEAASGLTCGVDFFLGYSPERINPGDREHGLERITKVVAGQTEAVTDRLAEIYGRLTEGGVFRARDIKTAEAAKVIENAQRDLNIAFVNEVAMIFSKLGLRVEDVLAAARTKWNFLDFRPGLVGGHCIGVDPYYLAHAAQAVGHHPDIILAGRRINDGMGTWIAYQIHEALGGAGGGGGGGEGRILVLGLTFKENVPDLRNSKVVDIVTALGARGYGIDVHDPLADPEAAQALYGIELLPDIAGATGYRAVIGAVAHDSYRALTPAALAGMLAPGGLLADVKSIWRGHDLPDGFKRWEL